jgi:hypothetical protein
MAEIANLYLITSLAPVIFKENNVQRVSETSVSVDRLHKTVCQLHYCPPVSPRAILRLSLTE